MLAELQGILEAEIIVGEESQPAERQGHHGGGEELERMVSRWDGGHLPAASRR